MYLYSTYIVGLEKVIPSALRDSLKTFKLVKILNGGILYETDDPTDQIHNLKFLINTFVVVEVFNNKSSSIKNMIDNFIKDKRIQSKTNSLLKITESKSYRIMFSNENKFISVDNNLRKKIEGTIFSLKLDRFNPETEVWFLKRSENIGLLLLRLTKKGNYRVKYQKGELRDELTSILVYLSEPSPTDNFCDPFCGHGSIGYMRMHSENFNMMFMGDIKEEMVNFTKEKLKEIRRKKIKKTTFIKNWDATNINNYFDKGFINKIVTDPPWGIYEDYQGDITELYNNILKSFSEILNKDSIVVLLTSRSNNFDSILRDYNLKFLLIERLDILVSGKKASIYKIKKR